jgi:hypothetical protein
VLDDRQRAGAGRNFLVCAEQREVGEAPIEQRKRLGIVGIVYNLEAKARGCASQDRRQPLGEMRLLAVGGTAKVRVSECLSQARPAQTVIAVRIKVSSANSITWPRLVMANCGRCGSLGTSAPMPSPQLPDFTLPCRNTRGLDRQIANCLKMNHYSAWL